MSSCVDIGLEPYGNAKISSRVPEKVPRDLTCKCISKIFICCYNKHKIDNFKIVYFLNLSSCEETLEYIMIVDFTSHKK